MNDNTFISVPFIVQKNAQEMYYKGRVLTNYDEVHCMLGKFINKGDNVYLYSTPDTNSNSSPIDYMGDIYTDPMKDILIGTVHSMETKFDEARLIIKVNDTLSTSKISNPVIRIAGLVYVDPENKNITMQKVTKITIGPGDLDNLYIM